MSVRNVNVGGTDFTDGEVLYAADLNDTFDEVINRLQNISTGHDHDGTDSKALDWDSCWADAVHSHGSDAEGAVLTWATALATSGQHTHAGNTTGGQLDWDTCWSDAVHSHGSDAEGSTLDYNVFTPDGDAFLIGIPQNAYRMVADIDISFTNEDFIAADVFTAFTGRLTTLTAESGFSSCWDETEKAYQLYPVDDGPADTIHNPDSFTNSTYAFDSNDATYAEKAANNGISVQLGKTFSARTIKSVCFKVYSSGTLGYIYLETYDGASWNDSGTSWFTNAAGIKYLSYNINASIQGIRVRFLNDSGGGAITFRLYTLAYGDTYISTSDIETDTILTLDGTEKRLYVYTRATKPSNTSITWDAASSGGGSVTAQAENTGTDISAFTAGNLSIDINLATTSASATPLVYGYAVYITK